MDVAGLNLDYPGHENSGFAFSAAVPFGALGAATLQFHVRTQTGEITRAVPIIIGSLPGMPLPLAENVVPARIELEEARLDPGGMLHVRGWAVGPTELAPVEVFLGTEPIGIAETGFPRADVAAAFPLYPKAASSGFTFQARVEPAAARGRSVRTTVVDAAGGRISASIAIAVAPVDVVPPSPDHTATPPAQRHSPEPLVAMLEEARVNEHGVLRVRGWAVGLAEIDRVLVELDHSVLGLAEKAISRDDVGLSYPGYPASSMSGFLLTRTLAEDEAVAGRTVRVTVFCRGGIRRELTAPLAAPAVIRRPARGDASIHFHCDNISLSRHGELGISGWAVCQAGVETIQIDIDDEPAGAAELGMDRPDVGNHFPQMPNARAAGFRFSKGLGRLYTGEHMVRLVLRGRGGEERAVLHPVLAEAAAAAPATGNGEAAGAITFYIDTPVIRDGSATAPVRGFMSLNGWAVAPGGIAGVEVLIDGVSLGDAFLGVRREDVKTAFPTWEGALLSGFAMVVPPQALKRGKHEVRVVLRDNTGNTSEARFSMVAEPAATAHGPWALRTKLTQAEIDVQMALLASACQPPCYELLLDLGDLALNDMAPRRWAWKHRRDSADWKVPGHAGSALGRSAPEGPSRHRQWRMAAASRPDRSGCSLQYRQAVRRRRRGGKDVQRARLTLDSLLGQVYPDWRLTIVVPPDTAEESLHALLLAPRPEFAGRVDVIEASSDRHLAGLGADAMPGRRRMVCLLSPGDVLGEDALLELAVGGALQQDGDFFYADERRIDPGDGEVKAFFKPDWSPDLLLSTNYIGRLWAASAALLGRTGVRIDTLRRDGEYDLVLRATEQAARIVHVPKVLCARGRSRLDTPALERRAIRRALQRRGEAAEIRRGCLPGIYRPKRDVTVDGLVSIIIPTMAARGLVKAGIDSIRARTTYRNFEIVVLDNVPAENIFWKDWIRENADVVVAMDEPFNWSRFNNQGVLHANGTFLLFLNDDIEVLDGDWLHALLEHAQRPEVGVVGPQLIYPDGKVQHAGMFLSHSVARHAFRFSSRDEPGPFGLALTQRDMISVTGACMLVRRDAFEALGGFDEQHSVVNNDLDYCLRAGRQGQFVVYTPHATLIHHEMVSRAQIRDVFDRRRFRAAWQDTFLQGDPFLNPNLSIDHDDYVPETEPTEVLYVGHPLASRDSIRNILVVKLDHIGDFIVGIPALRRIRQRFPAARLTVLLPASSMSLANALAFIDEKIEFNFFHARSELGQRRITRKEWSDLRETLAARRFDLAIDLRLQPDTRDVLKVTGARWLAGFDHRGGFRWLDIAVEWEGDQQQVPKRRHVVDSLNLLVDTIAASCETDRTGGFSRPAMDVARARAADLPAFAELRDHLPGRRLVCIHPGVGNETRRWPAPHFAALIDLLIQNEAVNVILIGGADEAPVAAEVLGNLLNPGAVWSMVGKTRLPDLATVLAACDLYVGNNSGPHHLAAALGVPTLGVHSGVVDANEWGPFGPLGAAIRRKMSCSPCYLATVASCHRRFACMNALRPGDVYRVCRRFLG